MSDSFPKSIELKKRSLHERIIVAKVLLESVLDDLPSAQPDIDLIHLQKEQAYMQGYEDGKTSRKGKWINHIEKGFCDCDYCGEILETERAYRASFCPNCGADMRGE